MKAAFKITGVVHKNGVGISIVWFSMSMNFVARPIQIGISALLFNSLGLCTIFLIFFKPQFSHL